MKKLVLTLLFVAIVLILCSCSLLEDGYLYFGDGWQDTPQLALKKEAESSTIDEERVLTVDYLLDTFYMDDMAFMLYVSANETLVSAYFVKNDEGQYHFHAYGEDYLLANPTFSERESFAAASYSQNGTRTYGYKYSVTQIKVNGAEPKTKTYTFTYEGIEYSIDYWWIDGIDESEEIIIECK